MIYDVPLVLAVVLFFFALIGFVSSLLEKKSPLPNVLTFAAGAVLFYYAWHVSDGSLGPGSVTDALVRVVSKFG